MRALLSAIAFAGLMAAAGAACADPVRIAPVTVSEDLQAEFADNFGERERPVLEDYIRSTLSNELARAGAQIAESAPITIETTLIDADPTKPTFEQLGGTLSLSYALSVSVGGAELHAVLRGADGQALTEVHHRRYAWGLDDVSLGGTWGDARRSIRQFAVKVARAYRSQLSTVETTAS